MEIQAKRNAGTSKRKFALKRTAQPQRDALSNGTASGSPVIDQSLSNSATSEQNALPADLPQRVDTQISDIQSQVYVHKESKSHLPSSASISNITTSVLDLSPSTGPTHHGFASMMIKDVIGSLLLCGNISGATHVTGTTNSTLLITCQQLRMHDCDNCVIYLNCKSRPIIETCSNLRFAPLTTIEVSCPLDPCENINAAMAHEQHRQTVGDKEACNYWDQVDDFNWLKAKPSPNWRNMAADDKRAIKTDIIAEMLTGRISDKPLKEILHLAKLDA